MGLEVGLFFRETQGGDGDPVARRLELIDLAMAVANIRTDLSIVVVPRDGYLQMYVPVSAYVTG